MSDKKFNNNIDLQQHELKSTVLHKLAAAPGSPVEALMYWDTVTKQMYLYDGSAFKFPGVNDLEDLSDTNFTGFVAATDKQYLVYDQGTGKWIPKTIVLDLINVGDVSYPVAPTNGQVLTYNTATSKWEPAASASGGLGINNAGAGRMVLSGASSVANLEAQETIVWNNTQQWMTFGATIISKEVSLRTEIKSGATSAITAGSPIGLIGSISYQGSSLSICGGLKITASENHAPALPNGTAVVLEFMVTDVSSGTPLTGAQIASNKCFVLSPTSYTDRHEKASMLINGGIAYKTRSLSNVDVIIDPSGYDGKVQLYVDDGFTKLINFPLPSSDDVGREIEITVFSVNGEVVQYRITGGPPTNNFWYSGVATSGSSTSIDGKIWKFVAVNRNGTYYWQVIDIN